MSYDQNRLRAFADVVSVDAWHESFEGKQQVDLKVDVVFTEGRIGGEIGCPVQFRLRLKSATLVVTVPETEPVEVVRDSIRREQDLPVIEWSTEHIKKTGASGELDGNASISLTDAQFGIRGQASARKEISVTTKEKSGGRISPIKTMFRVDNNENTFNWIIQAKSSEFLDGRVWDANASPLMKLRDLRPLPKKGIPPTVRVAIRCLREDLIISDIRVKDEISIRDRLSGKDEKIKLKAAEAYIRTKLCEIGLEVGDLSNDFAKIVLLEVAAKTSK